MCWSSKQGKTLGQFLYIQFYGVVSVKASQNMGQHCCIL